MPNSRNNRDQNNARRASSGNSSPRPSARKYSGPSSSFGSSSKGLTSGGRAQKKSKSSRNSKIPKTTTTSRLGRPNSGVPSYPQQSRSVKSPSKASTPSRKSSPSTSASLKSTSRAKNSASKERIAGAPSYTPPSRTRRTSAKPIDGNKRAAQKDLKTGPRTRSSYEGNNPVLSFMHQHPRVAIPVAVVFALLLLYCVVDLSASIGKIHPGVSVQGIDVGGMTTQEAAQKLTDELTPPLNNAHVTIYEDTETAAKEGVYIPASGIPKAYADEVAGTDVSQDGSIDKWNITAEVIGAYIDGEALAEKAYAVGRSGNFIADRFFSWFGGTKLDATVAVRDERFNSLMTEINSEVGSPIVNSTIEINKGKVTVDEGKDGLVVDTPEFIRLFSVAVFDPSNQNFIIPMVTDVMHISPETAQKVADQVQKAIDEDVTIIHQPNTWTLDTVDLGTLISQEVLAPNEVLVFSAGTQKVVTDPTAEPYTKGISVDPSSGYALQAYVDQEKTDEWLVSKLGDLALGGAEDAYFDTSSGDVVLVEAVEGYGPDRSAAELALQDLLFGSVDATTAKDRTITLVDAVIQPEITTAKAQSMGITERLATWSIPLSGTSERIHNLDLLCNMIDHSLVAPGQTWSFNDTTGERTAEKGFQTAPVIINGKHEDQLGGGICQIATCVYNCACFSGLGIEERVNHDFYIASYDEDGFNDATVSWRSPDLKWVNDMDTYVLLTAEVTEEDVVVSFWGTQDGRTVECERGEWRDGEKYVQLTEVDPEKPAGYREVTQTGQDGRSIDIRYICKDAKGNILHDILFHSIYSAQNEITTVGSGGSDAPESDSSSDD